MRTFRIARYRPGRLGSRPCKDCETYVATVRYKRRWLCCFCYACRTEGAENLQHD